MADIDNLKGGTKRVVEETEPLNNLRGGTKRVVIVGGGGGGSSLPDQTGQSGKFLTTDGTDASWSDKPLVNMATGNQSIALLSPSTSAYSVVIGHQCSVSSYNSTAIGQQTATTGDSSVAVGYNLYCGGRGSVCLGQNCRTNANYAIQISSSFSSYTNSDANTFKVANEKGNFEIMSADGTVPTARLTKVNTTATLAVADWSSNTQTVTVSGVKADSVVFVSPDPTSASDYASAGILCTAQAADSLTFTATTTPTNAITVNVVCM